jgi:DNA polymerase III delta prime subunit
VEELPKRLGAAGPDRWSAADAEAAITLEGVSAGRDINIAYPLPVQTEDRPTSHLLTSQELRLRRALLAQVRGEVANRLAQSLHHAVPINLLHEKHPQEVQRLWDVEVKIGTQPTTPVPSDTAMLTIFDEEAVAGKLLILGAPGAGKTTSLLELAQELVARAERDAIAPIPVLVSLSSWKDDSQPIASWLVAELHVKYGLRKDIGQRWVNECCLLPLLDGLDELGPMRQERCVQALNRFQREYGLEHLVVCGRLVEYQNCPTKLYLNGAVHLQPLTDEQIHRYLVGAGRPDLWRIVQADPNLWALAKSPLLLSMMTLTYEEKSIPKGQKPGSTHEHHQYLFDMYVEHLLSRDVNEQGFSKKKTLMWLVWLAQRLKEDFQAGFLIEKLQPYWLKSLPLKNICII